MGASHDHGDHADRGPAQGTTAADPHAGHAHDHGHHHLPPDRLTRAFRIGIALNLAFVVIEVIAGFAADSTALLADAAHNASDVLGLAMAYGATVLARRQRTPRRTYGLRRTTILAALVNATLIFVAIGGVVWEAIRRLAEPAGPVEGGLVAVVAAIGVGVNVGAALLFARGRERDVNQHGAYIHLLADAAVSAGVVVAGVIVWRTGWSWIDPATSLVVSVVIIYGTIGLLRSSLNMVLDAVPAHIDPAAVEAYLATLPGVMSVHDLHIWPASTTETVLTAHLVLSSPAAPTLVSSASAEIAARFGIGHTTLQIEFDASCTQCS